MNKFIRIPRNIIYAKDIGEERVFILSYLLTHNMMDDCVSLSVNDICNCTNKKQDRHINRTNHRYCNILSQYQDMNYIQPPIDFSTIWKSAKLSNTTYRIPFDPSAIDYSTGYGIIYLSELQLIYNYLIEHNENCMAQILLFLSYIRVNINTTTIWRYIKTITNDIGLNSQYIKKCAKILSDLNIIATSLGKTYKYYQQEKDVFVRLPAIFCNCYECDSNKEQILIDSDKEIKKCIKQLARD